jgi:hypothetical protein
MLRLLVATLSVVIPAYAATAGEFDRPGSYGDPGRRDQPPPPEFYPSNYLLPYGTYSGGYSNWRSYGIVGHRIAQYGPLSNKGVPRGKYNVRTGRPSGFDLNVR